jgi:ABC-type transport system substrate-binding protein
MNDRRLRALVATLVVAPILLDARPRYGGTLTVEMRGQATALDPTAADSVDGQRLSMLLFDRLVTLDGAGQPQPSLAASWTSDPQQRRWQFALRAGVRLHDGSPLTPGQAAAGVAPSLPGRAVAATPDGISIQSAQPMPNLLRELAHPKCSVPIRLPNGKLDGTGPFRAVEWEPGRLLVATAFDGYWGGRPYIDSVVVRMARPLRDQLAEYEAGRADVIEVTPAEFRRQEARGRATWTSATVDLVALVFFRNRAPSQDARLRQAMALAIDRGPIWSVLLQKQGEPTGSLLPGWLTGWGFVFPSQRDLARAKESAAGLPALSLGHDPSDFVLKSVVDRLALNGREAGLQVRAATADADAVVVRVAATSTHAPQVLADYARALNTPPLGPATTPDALYQAERRLTDGQWIVPLFHVPSLHATQPRVRDWAASGRLHWNLEEVWLAAP